MRLINHLQRIRDKYLDQDSRKSDYAFMDFIIGMYVGITYTKRLDELVPYEKKVILEAAEYITSRQMSKDEL